MRKNEILGQAWDRVDFQNRLLTQARTKIGQMRHVPPSDAAWSVPRDLQGGAGDGTFLFPARMGRLTDVREAWEEVRGEMARSVPKFKRCRFHDRGYTDASDLVVAGKSLEAVGRILVHTESSGPTTTRRNVHLRPEHLLDAAAAVKSVAWPLLESESVAAALHGHAKPNPATINAGA